MRCKSTSNTVLSGIMAGLAIVVAVLVILSDEPVGGSDAAIYITLFGGAAAVMGTNSCGGCRLSRLFRR